MTAAARKPIRVLLVSDHQIILWGLEALIDGAKPRMETVGKATTPGEALRLAVARRADVVLFDIDLGSLSGLDGIADLAEMSRARVLVLMRTADKSMMDSVMLSGASGILGKEEEPDAILKAISKVHEGEIWLDRVSTSRVFSLAQRRERQVEDPERRKIGLLTRREVQIVASMAAHAGTTTKKIAAALSISDRTLRNHLTSIYEKLGLSNRLDLFVYANKHGLAEQSDRTAG